MESSTRPPVSRIKRVGMGGTDIWMVEKRGITWSKPINLGPEVNTPKNEVYPFIHNSGNLFFSSNGFNGAGGLDIYMVNFDVGPSGTVVNLGEPFNTKADDLGLILNPEGIKGFFTSKRASGKGNDDIYMFEAPEGIWGKTVPGMLPAKRVTSFLGKENTYYLSVSRATQVRKLLTLPLATKSRCR